MSFAVAVDRVLTAEGGYSNDPLDPGGETIFGVTRREFPNFNGGNFKTATREQAAALYKTEFWDACHCDVMPPVLAFQALDFAVNSGVGTAIRKLQHAAGVADDGHWGPVTQAAVLRINPGVLTFNFLADRLDYMRVLNNWPHAGKGWAGRIAADMRSAAIDLLNPT